MVDANAYIQRPLWARWLQRVLYVIWYGLMVVAGYAAWSGLGFPAHEAGMVIMLASVVAAFGAATGYYHGELMALPPLMAALAVVVVWLQLPPQSAVLTGWLVAGFIAPLALRFLVLSLLARRQRREARRRT